MKFLVVEDQEEIREIITMVIENVDSNPLIHESPTVKGAQDFLSSGVSYDLVICDYNLLDGVGGEVFKYLRNTQKSKIPFIFQTSRSLAEIIDYKEFYLHDSHNNYLQKPYHPRILESAIKQALGALVVQTSKYVRIRTPFFLRYDFTSADIFIRLSDEKYIKLLPKNSSFTPHEINRLIEKNVDYLYVSRQECQSSKKTPRFIEFLSTKAEIKKDMQQRWEEHFEVVKGILNSYGLNEFAFTRCKSAISIAQSYLDKKDQAVTKLIRGQFYKGNYLSDHALMIAIVANAIASELEWGVVNLEEKFIQAALFHDITLTHEMAQKEVDEMAQLLPEELVRYYSHPTNVVKLLRRSIGFSSDVEKIILEHHERPDGSGFPRKLKASAIHPLSAVFIVAHDFVTELYQTEFDTGYKQYILAKLSERFFEGSFKMALSGLTKSLKIKPETNAHQAA